MISRNPSSVHQPLTGYTHQIAIDEPGRWLVLSGQVGIEPDGRLDDDPVAQVRTALANVTRNLEAAGMAVTDVVKLTIYLVGDVDTQRRREAISDWLAGHQPCMTVLYVSALAIPALRVDIDAWAFASQS